MNTHEQIKALEFIIDDERYRTDTSWLLAADENKGIYLYRAHNSNYFVHRQGAEDSFEILSLDDALSLYKKLPMKKPMKYESSSINAFPSEEGIGIDTPVRYDYIDEENED